MQQLIVRCAILPVTLEEPQPTATVATTTNINRRWILAMWLQEFQLIVKPAIAIHYRPGNLQRLYIWLLYRHKDFTIPLFNVQIVTREILLRQQPIAIHAIQLSSPQPRVMWNLVLITIAPCVINGRRTTGSVQHLTMRPPHLVYWSGNMQQPPVLNAILPLLHTKGFQAIVIPATR